MAASSSTSTSRGAWIEQRLRAMGLSKSDLARRMDVAPSTVHRWITSGPPQWRERELRRELALGADAAAPQEGVSGGHALRRRTRDLLDLVVTTLADESGGPAKLAALVEDLRQLLGDWEVREDTASKILDALPDVVWAAKLGAEDRMHFYYHSPSVRELRGLTPEEANAISVAESLTDTSWRYARRQLSALIADATLAGGDLEHPRMLDLELKTRGAGTRWVEANMRIQRGSNGKPNVVVGVSRDIGDRKLRSEMLAEIYEHGPLGLLLVSKTGLLLDANPRMLGILELGSLDELRGRSFLDITHPDDQQDSKERFFAAMDSAVPYSLKKRYRTEHSQRDFFCRTHVAPMRDATGRLPAAVCMCEAIYEWEFVGTQTTA